MLFPLQAFDPTLKKKKKKKKTPFDLDAAVAGNDQSETAAEAKEEAAPAAGKSTGSPPLNPSPDWLTTPTCQITL